MKTLSSLLKKSQFLSLTLVFFLCMTNSFSQSKKDIIKDIRERYTHIRNNLKNYDTVLAEQPEESTEGSETIGYYDGKDLKLITIIYFGETGKSELEYYFNDGKLFFAFEKHHTYNRPIYWDKKHMQENNDSETFDPDKTIITEDRYYFNKEKLISWIDNDKKEVDLTVGTNTITGQGLISHAHKIRDEIKKTPE